METDAMDIYELLKEENQRFWDFLDLDNTLLNPFEYETTQSKETYLVEEIETI